MKLLDLISLLEDCTSKEKEQQQSTIGRRSKAFFFWDSPVRDIRIRIDRDYEKLGCTEYFNLNSIELEDDGSITLTNRAR